MQVLICRLIDRPLRPTMLKGFNHETQILSWVKSLVIPPEEMPFLYLVFCCLYILFQFASFGNQMLVFCGLLNNGVTNSCLL